MAHDAPPGREAATLIDLPADRRSDVSPRLVALQGPRRQSTSITVSIRSLTTTLVIAALASALAAGGSSSPIAAQVVHWYTASLLALGALGVVILGKRPQNDQHHYLLGVAVLLGLSFLESAPKDAWPAVAAYASALNHYPFLTLVSGAAMTCAVFAVESRARHGVEFAPAIVTYMTGLIAAALCTEGHLEHPFSILLQTAADLGRMLGPVLLVRALLQHLSPATHPAALRFILLPSIGDASAPRTAK